MSGPRGGVAFNYRVGERILCFEPDPTKARVLYDAKIIEADVTRDEKNRKVPEYLIHFKGWNSSWDRWATEDHVVKDSEENRILQKQLAKEALAKIKKAKRAKQGKRCRLPGVETEVLREIEQEEEQRRREKIRQAKRRSAGSSHVLPDNTSTTSESFTTASEKDLSDVEGPSTAESEEEPTEIPVDIPVVLKDRLEEDHIMICKRGKLVQLPCQPNVITILENYLRYFAAKGTSVSDRLHHQLSRATQPFAAKFPTPANIHSSRAPPPERNVDLVKEVVDGVRIMFDFILPLTLLYQEEEVQHTQMAAGTFIPLTPPAGPTETGQAATPPPPKIRVTRSASRSPICQEAYRSHDTYPLRDSTVKVSQGQSSASKSDGSRLRRSRRFSVDQEPAMSLPPTQRKRRHSSISHVQQPAVATRQTETRTPSPPPLIPAPPPPTGEAATAMDASDKLSSVDTTAAEVKVQHKALLDEAMCKLLPDDFSQDGQNPPSLIYGAQHLLRLFVKLPELLGKMHLPEVKSKILCYHLQLFLKYLADRRDDLLPASAYVSAADVLGNLRQPKAIR
ncbi:MSL complex subunit 3-like [Branchiostoma lanceolatum]|uniref:MSL complex subunit 3-like n=1 Tax=Branchiostoma lanceolatum TaxID=7740 RepID=UPI003454C40D